MPELTLESLAERLAAVERELKRLNRKALLVRQPVPRTPEQQAFAESVDAEGRAWYEAQRLADLEAFDRENGR
ncbi:MAG: hypothetical protein U0746_16775 [Gemmataceae bacterium]